MRPAGLLRTLRTREKLRRAALEAYPSAPTLDESGSSVPFFRALPAFEEKRRELVGIREFG